MARKRNANARRQKKLKEVQQRKQRHQQKAKATHASEIRQIFQWLLPANRIFRELKLHGNTVELLTIPQKQHSVPVCSITANKEADLFVR